MNRLSEPEIQTLYKRLKDENLSIAELARQTGRDKSALYRLFRRRFDYKPSGSSGWSRTLYLPDDPGVLGYIAGIIDGEGCILHRSDGLFQVKVGMTDETVIRWLEEFGGKVVINRKLPNRKLSWTWHVSRKKDVAALLTAILPYMIVKKEKAKLTIDLVS